MDVEGQYGCMFVCGPQIMQNGGMIWPGSNNDNFPYPITHGTAACQQEEITMLFRIQMLEGDTVSSLWGLFQEETRYAYAALLLPSSTPSLHQCNHHKNGIRWGLGAFQYPHKPIHNASAIHSTHTPRLVICCCMQKMCDTCVYNVIYHGIFF